MSDIGSTMKFYHIKNLQSTKTEEKGNTMNKSFITLRIYKVLKLYTSKAKVIISFITLRIYKVLKPNSKGRLMSSGFITLRIYKVLKPQQRLYALIHS